ncbi:enoyl-CoA hydratase-related protein [Deinococcus yavapaiensis]|uniref:Enoyl-CoA hydratase n=1 Tax=Deinococcus yavapaiensis KR-236 TaxID=694435 RepID=A0A318S6D4_9DEIO|nr:enoyl-CoA hydratase-related protein [Deinococcus yavapaiensis]PYE54233.1 enoyl-CoA hydratase [Deinococcus yavapaiensis KR-236]
MTYTTIAVTTGEIAHLRLASKRGSLPPEFWEELPRALQELRGSRVLVITGEGTDFSVGLDLVRTAPVLAGVLRNRTDFLDLVGVMQGAVEALAHFPAPTIAAVSGWCIGAGVELAAACDIRLSSADARFTLPEVKLGIVPDLGGLGRLPHLIGEGWARRLALTGETIDASRAERLGLVSEVFESREAALEEASRLARDMTAWPSATLQGVKFAMNARLDADVRAHYRDTGGWNAAYLDPANVKLPK